MITNSVTKTSMNSLTSRLIGLSRRHQRHPAVACAEQRLEHLRVGGVLAEPVVLAGAVVVAGPGDQQAELGGQRPQPVRWSAGGLSRWSTSSPASPAAAIAWIASSPTVVPRVAAAGWAKTGTPPAARTSSDRAHGVDVVVADEERRRRRATGSSKASLRSATAPAATSVSAMCGRPTVAPSWSWSSTSSQEIGYPASASFATMALARGTRSSSAIDISAASAACDGSNR